MKKKFLLASLMLSLLLLCGCGVELASNVKLNKDFSGTRTMSCTFSSGDFKQHFNGSEEDLNQVIKESCPSVLNYSKHIKEEKTIYTFTLNFSSYNDYRKKAEQILNFSPKITWQYGDSPFVSGWIYKENFSSEDLMAWLYTALYEKKYIDKKTVGDLWDLKETTISFLGKTYKTDHQISIDEMSYAALSSIAIHTDTTKNGGFERKISFYIPQDTMEHHSGKILSYFKNQNIQWSSWEKGKILTVTCSSDSFTDLSAKTREILHSKTSVGTSVIHPEKGNPFSFQVNYEESLDFSNFIAKSGTIPVTYTYGKETLFDESVRKKTIKFSSAQNQVIDHYKITTVWNDESDIRRSFSFSFTQGNQPILPHIKKNISGTTIQNVVQNKNSLYFEQHGSVSACNKDLHHLFQDSSLQVSKKRSLFQGTLFTLEDVFGFKSGSKNVKGTYTFASIGQGRFEQVTLLPKEKIQKKEQQHVSDRDVAALLRSDETIHSSVRYEVLTDHIKLSYKGNTAARFWSDAARMILPLLFFGAIALFLIIRRNRISDCLRRAKDRLEHWLETKR